MIEAGGSVCYLPWLLMTEFLRSAFSIMEPIMALFPQAHFSNFRPSMTPVRIAADFAGDGLGLSLAKCVVCSKAGEIYLRFWKKSSIVSCLNPCTCRIPARIISGETRLSMFSQPLTFSLLRKILNTTNKKH